MKKSQKKKISAILPRDLLDAATHASDLNQTDAIIAGLQELIAKHKRMEALKAFGKVHIKFDAETVRQRSRL